MNQIPNVPPTNPDYMPLERKKFETYPTLPGQNYQIQQPQYNQNSNVAPVRPVLTTNPSAPSFDDLNQNTSSNVTAQSQYPDPNQNFSYPNIVPTNGQMPQMPMYPNYNQGQNVCYPINNGVGQMMQQNNGVQQGHIGYSPKAANMSVQPNVGDNQVNPGYPMHFNQNQVNSTVPEKQGWNSNIEVGHVVTPDDNIYDSQGNIIRKGSNFSNSDKDSWAIVNPTDLPNKTDVDNTGNSADEQISKRNDLFNKLKNSNSIKVTHFRDRGLTKFEIKIDNGNFIDLQGAEKDQMLNGFSLKLMTLGIVNTRFALNINDSDGLRVLQILRRVGSSDTVEIRQNLTGKKDDYITIGYITPQGLGNLTRVEYILQNDTKQKIGSVTSGALRGLFSDDFTLKYKKDELAKLKRNGLIQFTKKADNMGLGNRLLTIACVMLIKFNV